MKKTYHLCLSAGDEIMFRDLEDYHRGFNCFACALYKTDSTGLVESFMSTHTHQLVQTECPEEFMYNFRQTYSMFFNKNTIGGDGLEKNIISPWKLWGTTTHLQQQATHFEMPSIMAYPQYHMLIHIVQQMLYSARRWERPTTNH